MRYQIKEALDKISEQTQCDPRKAKIDSAKPNQIRLSCIDEKNTRREFIYTSGELFVLSKSSPVKLVPPDEFV